MEGQFGVQTAPFSLADVEKALREHDASRQAIQELFKFAHTESQQIINKIRQQVNWPHKHIKKICVWKFYVFESCCDAINWVVSVPVLKP